MSYYYDKLIELEADGIDFIPISDNLFKKDYFRCSIIKSYTKENLKDTKYFPRTSYLFWKIIDGKKVYLDD